MVIVKLYVVEIVAIQLHFSVDGRHYSTMNISDYSVLNILMIVGTVNELFNDMTSSEPAGRGYC